MFKRLARHPLTLLTALTAVFALYMGCAETQPVSSPFTRATVNLSPRAFPSPPDGMIYELWVQRQSDGGGCIGSRRGDTCSKSLGRFGWDQGIYVMRDSLDFARDRNFTADFNILDWNFLSVSVENLDSSSVLGPGPIFLRDTIFPPEQREFLLLKYPIDFSAITTGVVSLETPTDGNFSNDPPGVWFAIYSTSSIRTQDTVGVSATELVQVPRNAVNDASNGSTLDTIGIDSVMRGISYQRYTRFNLDTFTVQTVRAFFEIVPINWFDTTGIDSIITTIVIDTTVDSSFTPPGSTFVTDTIVDTFPTVDSSSVQYIIPARDTFPPDTINYGANRDFVMQKTVDVSPASVTSVHQFDNGFTELFDLNGTGWHYKGWVLGPYNGDSPQKFVRMNLGEQKETNWEKQGRTLFTTGIFYDTLVKKSLNQIVTTFYGKNPDGADSLIARSVFDYWGEAGFNTVDSSRNTSPQLSASNPFASQPAAHLPPFPGEDFLNPPVVLMPNGPVFDFRGSVFDTAIAFITIEPDNYHDTTKNFPLILMGEEINRSLSSNFDYKNIELRNLSPVNFPTANKRKSWPHILVDITLE